MVMDDNLEQRAKKLQNKLDSYSQNKIKDEKSHRARGHKAYSEGFKLVVEFASVIFVATFIGYFIDQQLDSLPFGVIIGVMMGFITGVYNLIRHGNRMQKQNHDANLSEDDEFS